MIAAGRVAVATVGFADCFEWCSRAPEADPVAEAFGLSGVARLANRANLLLPRKRL